MKQYNIQFDKIESLDELEGQIDKECIIVCDDIQNTFMTILYDDVHRIGIAYYDYGIKPAYLYSHDYTYLYLGFGKKIICIDLNVNAIIESNNTLSIFYEFIQDAKKNYICAICELDLYCYWENKILWKIGFKDVVDDYKIIDDSKISIECDDGMVYLFSLKNGELIE